MDKKSSIFRKEGYISKISTLNYLTVLSIYF